MLLLVCGAVGSIVAVLVVFDGAEGGAGGGACSGSVGIGVGGGTAVFAAFVVAVRAGCCCGGAFIVVFARAVVFAGSGLVRGVAVFGVRGSFDHSC